MKYKCINSFISNYSGKHYCYGSEIYQNEYDKLTQVEQQNFQLCDTCSNLSFSEDSLIPDLQAITGSMVDPDNPEPDPGSPDSDFDGFKGGDGGGAGADGEW